ncbi:MAG: efflux RND transporter periplasmic adaptor subunit [Cyanobacteria bacterium SZAS-4]|nr:efflux RND transporter periplasmic adaptor subunit [Cyanobacteria bacterium SZAS-4]
MTDLSTLDAPTNLNVHTNAEAQSSLVEPISNHNEGQVAFKSAKRLGMTKLVGVSGLVMASILPIGLVPRFMQLQELNQTQQKIEEHVPAVSTTQPVPAPSERPLNLPGTIEAIVETPVYARTDGYVSERLVDIGDRVRTGQLLAKLQTPEVDDSERESQAQLMTSIAAKAQSEANRERARADLDKAQADVSQAQANVVENESEEQFALSTNLRYKTLGVEGAVSAQDVDEKLTRYKSSQAARTAAQERVKAARSEVIAARARLKAEEANVNVSAANIATARAHAERSTTEKSFQNVVSPFNGVITERNIDQGMLISSGSDNSRTALFKLARIDTVKVFVDVPQYASNGVRIGQNVRVDLKEFPGKQYTGKVARTSVALDANARTLRTEIHIPNADFKLVPGMYADVSFAVARPHGTVQIPANALVINSDGTQVLTVSHGKTHYRKVRLGEDLGKQVEVLSGITKNDTIVVNPLDTLSEGTTVTESK